MSELRKNTGIDDIPHYLIKCPKVAEVWYYWFNWCAQLPGMAIKNSLVIKECLIFWIPTEAM